MRYSFWARVVRTVALFAGWGTLTVAVFFVTIFDPFMTSMPLIVGTVSVYRGWKGRYRVRRCCAQVAVRPLAEICFPHHIVLDQDDIEASTRRFGEVVSRLVGRAIGR